MIPFQPKIFLACLKCKDIIHSKHSGHYRSCSCGEIAIDETPYYYRTIGEMWRPATEEEKEDALTEWRDKSSV